MGGRRSVCISCGKFKPREEFSVRENGKARYWCKKCESIKKLSEVRGKNGQDDKSTQ